MAGITKNFFASVIAIVIGGVTGDYVAKPLVEAAKPWIVAWLGQLAPPPAKPDVAPPPAPQSPPVKPRPTPRPKRAAPAAEPKPAPPAPAEPRPKAEAPEPMEPPKPRPAPRLVPPPPAPHQPEWAESPEAYAGDPERGDESWPEREPPEPDPRLARDEERREPPPEPAPAAVPPDGWPVYCGYQRLCSHRRARPPEWRLW